MTIQEQLIEAVRGLPPLDRQKVPAFVQPLQHSAPAPESLHTKAKRLGAVGMISDAPPDLSSNKGYLANFARD